MARIKPTIAAEGILKLGDARDTIPALALTLGAQLIVVGSHGRLGVARACSEAWRRASCETRPFRSRSCTAAAGSAFALDLAFGRRGPDGTGAAEEGA